MSYQGKFVVSCLFIITKCVALHTFRYIQNIVFWVHSMIIHLHIYVDGLGNAGRDTLDFGIECILCASS